MGVVVQELELKGKEDNIGKSGITPEWFLESHKSLQRYCLGKKKKNTSIDIPLISSNTYWPLNRTTEDSRNRPNGRSLLLMTSRNPKSLNIND